MRDDEQHESIDPEALAGPPDPIELTEPSGVYERAAPEGNPTESITAALRTGLVSRFVPRADGDVFAVRLDTKTLVAITKAFSSGKPTLPEPFASALEELAVRPVVDHEDAVFGFLYDDGNGVHTGEVDDYLALFVPPVDAKAHTGFCRARIVNREGFERDYVIAL